MKLYIAEKPSLGRAIAAAIPGQHKSQKGWIDLANGDVVSWCVGHLLEQAEPDVYDPAFKSWKLEHLPIVPQEWQLKAKPKMRSQLATLRKLVKQAEQIVHCGDPDREGQLLVDEVLGFFKLSKTKTANVQRCLINDLNPSAVKRALKNLRSNKEFISLSVSALARSRADWLYGLNMTRAYTLQGQQAGLKGVLSVGRVQTPLLGLVARRDEEIAHFISRDFYQVTANIQPDETIETADAHSLTLKWQPSEACRPYQDEDGRVLHRALAENVCQRIEQQAAHIDSVERKDKKQPAPLLFNLSTLQIEAAKAYGMSAKQVLDTCQTLYERHQLITYPRSDCRHLPLEQHAQALDIIKSIAASEISLSKACDQADSRKKSKCWNDQKVEAHHAIIPTMKIMDTGKLSSFEQKIYRHISRQYLMQFYPDYQYAECKIAATIAGGKFTNNSKAMLDIGWKVLYGPTKKSSTKKINDNDKDKNKSNNSDSEQQTIPADLKAGDIWHCYQADIHDKKTSPPEHFNDATLLAAMTGIARFVSDKNIRATLKDTDGLGTEATRAGIIELLFKRQFLQRQSATASKETSSGKTGSGKKITITALGQALIKSLPLAASSPDMTALWEQQLDSIHKKTLNYTDFIQPLETQLTSMIEQARSQVPQALSSVKVEASNARSYKKSGKTGAKRQYKKSA